MDRFAGTCALVLTLGALVTGYLVLLAYAVEPDGSWDHQAVTNSKVAAGLALLSSAVLVLLTWATIKTGWLRTWWYALPAACAIAAALRLTLLAPNL
ncbi:hypothetical protein [Streptomyces sp. NPDC002690]